MNLDLISEPHVKDLASRGFVRGLTYYSREPLSAPATSHTASSQTKSKSDPIPLCNYYGGVRYALPPAKRWRRARHLPPDFVYGTRHNPGDCTGRTRECPQPGRAHALRKKLKRKLREEGEKLEENEAAREDVFQCNVWCPLDEEERPEGGMFIHSCCTEIEHVCVFSEINTDDVYYRMAGVFLHSYVLLHCWCFVLMGWEV